MPLSRFEAVRFKMRIAFSSTISNSRAIPSGWTPPQHPVSLYPNPASRVVYVQGHKLPEKVQLYTLNGQLVDEHLRSKAIPVRDLHSGVYLVKIQTAGQVVSRKLVVY